MCLTYRNPLFQINPVTRLAPDRSARLGGLLKTLLVPCVRRLADKDDPIATRFLSSLQEQLAQFVTGCHSAPPVRGNGIELRLQCVAALRTVLRRKLTDWLLLLAKLLRALDAYAAYHLDPVCVLAVDLLALLLGYAPRSALGGVRSRICFKDVCILLTTQGVAREGGVGAAW